jgi:hypothetical protein
MFKEALESVEMKNCIGKDHDSFDSKSIIVTDSDEGE